MTLRKTDGRYLAHYLVSSSERPSGCQAWPLMAFRCWDSCVESALQEGAHTCHLRVRDHHPHSYQCLMSSLHLGHASFSSKLSITLEGLLSPQHLVSFH